MRPCFNSVRTPAYRSLTVHMKSRRGCLGAVVLLTLFSPSRAWAQHEEESALPAPPPPPPGAPVEKARQPAAPAAGSVLRPPSTLPVRGGLEDPERNWYGWQLLINDFVALGALGGAAAAGVKGSGVYAVIVPAALVYDLGSPTIHWLHGRKAIAGASFGVRAGVPLLGVLMGVAVAGCTNDHSSSANSCRSQGAGYGALARFAAATAIDASLFAFDAPAREKHAHGGFRCSPLAAARHGGGMPGLVGVF